MTAQQTQDVIATRTIEGRVFEFADWGVSQHEAQAAASEWRARGYYARVVREALSGGFVAWCVYIHPWAQTERSAQE